MNKKIEQTISSLEVAEMVGKEHNKLLRDIRTYIKQLSLSNLGQSDFFTESTYKNRGREYPCYNVTKKGCEFIAHKLTGAKGTEFTAKYINRFHQMEQIITEHVPKGKELLALAVLEAQKTIEDLQASNTALLEDNKRMKPKEIFADAVATSQTSILIGDLAKILKQNGINIGQNRLFAWMREKGYLAKRYGDSRNMPTQRAMDLGLFKIKETVINTNAQAKIRRTVKVTGKGQQYFINKFLTTDKETIVNA
jgi:Rha family phage regulatory protein